MDLVVDASVALGWILTSQGNALTEAIERALSDGNNVGWVPSHFGMEVIRTLRGHERRALIAPEIVDRALAQLQELALEQDPTDTIDILGDIVSIARHYTLRVADAAYLELALRMGLPLATRDRALASAAERAGAALFKP